jgi:hypothetical protein
LAASPPKTKQKILRGRRSRSIIIRKIYLGRRPEGTRPPQTPPQKDVAITIVSFEIEPTH